MSDYQQRKADRRDYYLRHVHGWKLRPCSACSGSGYYDGGPPDRSTPCGACEGTGKERYRGPKSPAEFHTHNWVLYRRHREIDRVWGSYSHALDYASRHYPGETLRVEHDEERCYGCDRIGLPAQG